MERNDAQTTPLAIIGMACLFPKADGLSGYWANVKRRVDAITEVPASHWAPEDYFDADPKKPDFTYARRGGFLEPVPFDPGAFGISPNTLEATDASQLLGLVVAQEALKNAGYADNAAALERTSVILGVTGTLQLAIPLGARLGHPFWRKALAEAGVEGPVADQIVERIAEAYVPWQENSFPGLLGNVVAGRIANRLNLGGTNCVVDAACASSLSATHMAAMELAAGRSDLVVTGGVDCFNDIFMYMCFSKTPALSPTGDSRPFDANGDGTILGEGIGMVVLKRLADAERDGDPIYAVIRSVGSSSDGRGKAIYAPSEEGQMKALRAAYKLAQVSPETIELIEAHGTGTKVGDAVELNALTEVYRAARPDGRWVALGSVKSQIGHTKAAAGVAGLIKAALALHHKVLPPTIKVREPQPAVATDDSPFYLNTELRPWLPRRAHPRRAAVSAFGFGGSNFHAVLEEHDAEKRNADWDGCVELVALSADSPQALETKLGAFTAAMTWTELQRAAATARGAFEASHPHRLAFVLEKSAQNLEAVLANVRAQLKEGRSQWTTPDGAAYGSGPVDGQLGVLFPGQGAQYVGMGRDLFARFPDLLSALAQADRAFADGGEQAHGDRLSDRLFPIPTFQAEAHEAQETALRATQCAQPAIGAMSLGAFRLLERFAVNPAAMAGHSYGELSALVAAGRLSEDDFFHLSCLRGRLMAEGQGDRGTMLAVQAPQAQVAELVERHGLSVVLANKNAPNQVVLSGETAAIAAAEQVIKDAGLRAVRLPVAAAFHSPLVADAARPFREALDDVLLFAGTVPVYANTTGALYPDDDAEARDLLGHQLAEPVEFVSQVQAMHAAGVRTFLEVGPGNRLSGLVKAILKDQPYQAIALDASGGKRDGVTDLARALAQLAALGHAVDLKGWENGGPKAPAKKPGMTIPLTGANYRSAKKPSTQPVLKVSTNGHAQAPASVTAALPTNGNGHAKVNGTAPHPASAPQATPTPKRVSPPPMPNPQPNAQAPAPALLDALKATQDSMAMLQKLQEQTAQLHKQFLDGQQTTQQAFKHLVDQQQQIFAQSLGLAGAPAPVVSERLVQAAPSAPALAVECTLLAIVAEKTGYPVEMLNADMDLEADLGIDSIKRVEILGAVSERVPDLPEFDPGEMAALKTLGEIVTFMRRALPAGGPAPTAAAVAAPAATASAPGLPTDGLMPRSPGMGGSGAPAAGPDTSGLESLMLEVVAEKTGYPVEMLNLEMALESDLGIDSIKRVEILGAVQERVPGLPDFDPGEMAALKTLGQIVDYMRAQLGGGAPAAPAPAAAPVVAAAPVTTVAAPAASTAASADLEALMLAVVAEKTGYPVEMLNLEMALESDLGIDSIKRVEILGAVQERVPGLPDFDPGEMAALKTLGQIVDYMRAQLGGGAPVPPGPGVPAPVAPAPVAEAAPLATAPAQAAAPAGATADLEGLMMATVAEKTGYPVEMLNLDMALEADLGIDSIKRVEILSAVQEQVPGLPEFDAGEMAALRTLGQIVDYMRAQLGAPAPSAPAARPVAEAAAADYTSSAPSTLESVVPEPQATVAEVAPAVETAAEAPVAEPEPEAAPEAAPETAPVAEATPASTQGAPTDVSATHGTATNGTATNGTAANGIAVNNTVATNGAAAATPASAPAPATKPVMPPVKSPFGAAFRSSQGGLRQVLRVIEAPPAGEAIAITGGALVTDDGTGVAQALVDALGARGVAARVGDDPSLDAGLVICLNGLRAVAAPSAAAGVHRDALALARGVAPRFTKTGGVFVTVQDTGGDFGVGGKIGDRGWLGGLTGLTKTAAIEWPLAHCKAIDIERGALEPKALAERIADEILAGGPDLEVGLRADGSRVVVALASETAEAVSYAPWVTNKSVVLASGGARGVTAAALEALAKASQPKIVLLGRSPLVDEPESVRGMKDGPEMKRALLEAAKAEGRPLTPADLGRQVAQIMAAREVRDTLRSLRRAGSEALYLEIDVRDVSALKAGLTPIREAWGPITGLVHGAGVLADKLIADLTPEQFDRVFETKVDGLRALLAATADDPLSMICMFSSIAARTGNTGQAAYAMANEVLNKVAQAETARRGRTCLVKSLNWGPWAGGMVTPELKAHFEKQGVPLIPLELGGQMFVDELRQADPGDVEVVLGGPSDPTGVERSLNLPVSLDSHSHPQMDGHRIQDSPVLPAVQVLDWFIGAAVDARPDLAFAALKDLKVLKGVPLERYNAGGDRFTVRCTESGQALLTELGLELRSEEGTTHYKGTAVLTDRANHLAPLPALPPLELEPSPWSDDELYGALLFHGAPFRVIRSVEGVSRDGMVAVIAGLRAMGWPEGTYQTDVAAMDGALQIARLWGYHMASRPSLPTAIAEFRRYVAGPADGPLRVDLRGRAVNKHRTLSDIRLTTLDGTVMADMRGVEMHFLPERKPAAAAASADERA